MIKVSVIIPIYKVPLEYLRICLDSLVAQAMLECEFIIVSDGAPDAECSICEEATQKDSRFLFFRQEHQGVAAAKQFGLDKACGQYVTFVDSDDWVEQNYLNEIYKIAVENSLEILNWDYRLFPTTSQVKPLLNHSIVLLNEKEKELFLNNILINQNFGQSLSSCCTRLYKASFVKAKKITFNTELSIGEDKAFNYQAYIQAERLGYVNKTYYNYRMREDSTVHKFIPNSLPIYLKYITYISSFCLPQNKDSLGKEFLNVFFHSLNHSYFPSNKKIVLRESLSNLKKAIVSKDFQQSLNLLERQKISLQMQLYLFCLRKHLLFPIYKKGLVYYIQREISCFFKK